MEHDFPLFKNIYEIAFQGASPKSIVHGLIEEHSSESALPIIVNMENKTRSRPLLLFEARL